MPESPRVTAQDAEKRLLKAGFGLVRQKGSHKIYVGNNARTVIPHHPRKVLHPNIVAQILAVIEGGDKGYQLFLLFYEDLKDT